MKYPNANCRGDSTRLFFSDRKDHIRSAAALCATCPHLDPCKAEALNERPRPVSAVQGGIYFDGRSIPRNPTKAGRGRPAVRPRPALTIVDPLRPR